MDLVFQPANQRIILNLTTTEVSTVRHLNRVYGANFIRDYLLKFIQQRNAQRRAARREAIMTAFIDAPAQTKQEVLTALGVTFNDE